MSRKGTIAGSEKLPIVIVLPAAALPAEELLPPPQAAMRGARLSVAPAPTAPRITSLRVYERAVRSCSVWSFMLRSFGRIGCHCRWPRHFRRRKDEGGRSGEERRRCFPPPG